MEPSQYILQEKPVPKPATLRAAWVRLQASGSEAVGEARLILIKTRLGADFMINGVK
jgi:hypothetical protein